jgi:hypothetical protein
METAFQWFQRKTGATDTDVQTFALIDTDYWEFTAWISPWLSDAKGWFRGYVFRTAPDDGAEWTLEYDG